MPPENEKSRIEQLKQSLYSRTAPDIRTRRKLRFSEPESKIQTEWQRPAEDVVEPVLNKSYEDHSMSFLTKLLIASAIFCIIAVGAGAYLFFNGSNLISANNIDISISGPVSIPGGEPVSFDVGVINKNNVELQVVDMAVDFPAGSTDPADPTKELRQYRKVLGNISTGGTAHDTIQAVIFGEENMQKQITVTLTYGIKGSTSVFTKSKSYDVLINSSPINVAVSSFKEISSGQEFDMKVKVKSNSQQTLRALVLKATYPFGYTFISSSLSPLSDNATWKMGDIPAGAERTITIHGKLQGEDTDARTFRFIVGAQSSSQTVAIGTEYMTVQQDITIQKPFISLGLSIRGDDNLADFVSSFGKTEIVEVTWFNNLDVPVNNAVVTLHLSGTAYDRNSIHPETGYFRSATDDIIWNQQTTPDLGSIEAGGSGHVTFSFAPGNPSTATRGVLSPSMLLSVTVTGDRTQESNVPEAVTVATSRLIKVSSNISLSGRVIRSFGPFTNSGPIPPQVDKKTTYTVVWTVDNTSSAVSGAQVTAKLPPNVTWMNNVSPSGEVMTYDKNTNLITWNIGNVSTYTSGSSRRREVSFQLTIQPNVGQVDIAPILVNQATLSALDSFTGEQLQDTQDELTTRFSTDPAYKGDDELVVK